MNNIYAAIEIGTSRTVLAVAEARPGERLRVTAHAEIASTGIRKSQILDIRQATQSIQSVLHSIAKSKGGESITIGNAFLVVSGQGVVSAPYAASVPLGGQRVGNDDLNAVLRAAHSAPVPRDRELLDIVEQDYAIDNRGGIQNPRGLSGSVLSLNTLQIHADSNRIRDARTAADEAKLEIRDCVYAASAAAEAVLEESEKKNGVLVIDFGGGSTSYALYCDGYLVASGVIGIGGDHVTNDIAYAFQTTNAQAEGLKVSAASAVPVGDTGDDRVKVDGGSALMDNRTVSRRALDTVVNARMLELLSIVRENLEEQGLLHRLHAGVVLTGGGSRLRNLDQLVQQSLGSGVRLGRPIQLDGLDDTEYPPAFATIAGALLYAQRNYEEKSIFDDLIGKFFNK